MPPPPLPPSPVQFRRPDDRGMCAGLGGSVQADHDRRALLVEEQAKKPGPLRMFKATASNTFRPNQIKERESKEARLVRSPPKGPLAKHSA